MSRAALVCLLLVAVPAAAQAPPSAARGAVESFHAVLLEGMRGGSELGFAGRYERILVALDRSFDLRFMARTALGPTWRELAPAERDAFVALTRRYSASRYADNFRSFAEQRFETRGEEPGGRGTLWVRTRLLQPHDRDVRFDYRLRRDGDAWRIIDVRLDGLLSELALQRSQYRALIDRGGMAELERVLLEKIELFSSRDPG